MIAAFQLRGRRVRSWPEVSGRPIELRPLQPVHGASVRIVRLNRCDQRGPAREVDLDPAVGRAERIVLIPTLLDEHPGRTLIPGLSEPVKPTSPATLLRDLTAAQVERDTRHEVEPQPGGRYFVIPGGQGYGIFGPIREREQGSGVRTLVAARQWSAVLASSPAHRVPAQRRPNWRSLLTPRPNPAGQAAVCPARGSRRAAHALQGHPRQHRLLRP